MTHVADEVLGKIAWQQHNLFHRVKEGDLDPEKISRGLQDLIEGKIGLLTFQRDMRKEGWKLVEDVGETNLFSPDQLKLAAFRLKKSYIKGKELIKRAKKMQANLGQRQAEYLLDHQDEIPEEWRQYCLIFSGTIWHDRCGCRYIPYLRWRDEWRDKRWCQNFRKFDDLFFSPARLLPRRE